MAAVLRAIRFLGGHEPCHYLIKIRTNVVYFGDGMRVKNAWDRQQLMLRISREWIGDSSKKHPAQISTDQTG
ncbi:MAG: hypothetical protein ACK5PB_18565 [Pirellula sp.]|jgi:hypothetical protein